MNHNNDILFVERFDVMKVYNNVIELIGKTPLMALNNYSKSVGLSTAIIGKLEFLNPAGSVKDRVAMAMISDAEKKGLLKAGSVIIEPTSGNTGIGIASVATAKGYKVILTMPETMSVERRNLLKSYGAEIVLTDGKKGMNGAVEKAKELQSTIKNSVILGQFENSSNPQVHYETTGAEIWSDLDGQVDIFVAGVGTGGTLSGTGKYLKEKNNDVKIIAVEPAASPLLSKGEAGPHKIQGIGANFVPENLDKSVCDAVVTVTDKDAYDTTKKIAQWEGILVGISSGASVWAATQLAMMPENQGKKIVALLPDSGERYISTGVFDL